MGNWDYFQLKVTYKDGVKVGQILLGKETKFSFLSYKLLYTLSIENKMLTSHGLSFVLSFR